MWTSIAHQNDNHCHHDHQNNHHFHQDDDFDDHHDQNGHQDNNNDDDDHVRQDECAPRGHSPAWPLPLPRAKVWQGDIFL